MALCFLRVLYTSFVLGMNTTASVIAIGTIVAKDGTKNTAVGFGSPYGMLSTQKIVAKLNMDLSCEQHDWE